MKIRQEKIFKWLKILVGAYLIGGILLYFLQDLFLFHPKKLPQNHSFQSDIPFNEININVDEKRNLNFVQFPTRQPRKGVVLYFHGNMRNIERYAQFAPFFTRNAWDVWMVDYPGFGKSTGRRTEEVMYEDALRLYHLALQEVEANEIIIYGKSLGTGVASYLASQTDCRRLILETPYYSIKALTHHYAPIYPPFLTKYSFPIYSYLKQVQEPVAIIHGTRDEVIPYAHALRLKKELPKINLFHVPGGRHNTLYQFKKVPMMIDSLLSQ